jgi:large repetitive protein
VPIPSNAQFTPILLGGAPLFDVTGDESPASTDIVGNSTFPAAYVAYDGENVYFRLRLNSDPRNNALTSFRNFAWGVLINTTGTAGTYDWLFNVDGLNNRVSLIRNTVKLENSWNDPAEGTGGGNPNYAQSITNFDFARVTPADSNFGGDPDYFIDWFLPASVVFSFLGINASSQIRIVDFTSANSNNYNKDSLRVDEGFSFSSAISDPLTPDQADVRARLRAVKTLNSGPTSVLIGQQASWTGTITIQNTGLSAATTIIAENIDGLDVVNSFTVNSVSQGLTSYQSSSKTLTWNIGNLDPGATAVLTFTESGAFTTTGSRTLDRVQASGFDSFSGNAINSNSAPVNVTAQQSSAIDGTISDAASGLVLPGTTVNLLQGMAVIASIVTNGTGYYSFTNLLPGNYTVQAVRTNYVTGTANVTAVSGTTQTANIALAPLPSSISGNVSSGGAVAGATVTLTNNIGVVIDTTTTDGSGDYSFPSATPGAYNVVVTAAGYQSQVKTVITEPNQAYTVDFTLIANPGSISGTIRNAVTPASIIAGASVELLNGSGVVLTETTSNGSGQYSFGGLAPGIYQIRASALNFGTAIASSTVTAGDPTTTDVFLQPDAGSLQGTVRDAGTLAAISGATVQVVNSQNVLVATTLTNGGGQYSVTGLVPGSYSVVFLAEGYSSQAVGAVITSNAPTTVNAELSRLAGTLTGVVQNSGAAGIAGSLVTVFQSNIQIAAVNTDENGAYTITGLAPGTYTVVFSAENYQTATLGAMIENGQTTTLDVTLAGSPGRLTGTVLNEASAPVSGATLTVQISTGTGIIIATAVTENDGTYTVEGLAPGSYSVVASAVNFQTASKGAVITSNTTTTVNFTLAADPGSIMGSVTNAQTGQPVSGANVQVSILDSSGTVVAAVLSDNLGKYTVNGLAPGIYTVQVSAPDFQTNSATVQVQSNQESTADVALVPNPGAVTGTVVNSVGGAPIAGAVINVVNSSGILVSSTLTNQDGIFMAEGLAPDTYTVFVFADTFQNGSVGTVVLSGLTSSVSVALVSNPGAISGTVTPVVANTIIQLRDTNNILINSVPANSDGTFQFPNLAPGVYVVTASAPGYASSQAGATVNAGQTENISLTMLPNPASVSGTIFNPDGQPVINAVVQIQDLNGVVIGTGQTDTQGNYAVGNLPPGTFNVAANAPDFGQAFLGISLQPGEVKTGVNLTLIPDPGTLNGQITNRLTQGIIEGATVVVSDSLTQLPVASTTTTLFGNYTITGLAPGSYIVTASKANFTTEQIGAIVISNRSTTADLSLGPNPGRISGSVLNTNGIPITGSEIAIAVYNENNILVTSLVANSDGTYTVPSLAPGTYFVTASAPGYASSTVSAVVNSNQTTNVTNRLAANPVTLTVSVVIQGTTTPISGANVNVRHSNNLPVASGVTDETGVITFTNLPAGTLTVAADANTFGTDTATVIGAPGDELSARLRLVQNPGQILGYITNLTTGEPIPNAVVQLYNFGNVLVATAVSNQFGEYSFSGVSPGGYIVTANAADFGPETAGANVMPDQTSLLSFALSPNPGIIEGYVRNEVNNAPIPNATVTVRELSGTGPVIFTTSTDQNGFFRTTALSPRVYVLVGGRADFGSNAISAEVSSGQTTDVTIFLTPDPGSLQGTVRDAATNQLLADTLIRVIDNTGVVIRTVQTDVNGDYIIPGLAPGHYTVTAVNPNYQSELSAVTVESDTATTLNFRLAGNPATLSGIVTDAITGAPLTGVVLEVVFSGTDTLVRRVLTDENGFYLIEGLPAGTFDVKAQLQNYAISVNTVFLSPNEREVLNVALIPFPAAIEGTVRNSVTNAPIQRALVSILLPNSDVVIASIITGTDGTYRLENLPSGSYNVVITSAGFSSEVIPVILTPSETETVNAFLVPDPAAIRGRVTNANTSAPLAGALVRVFNLDGVLITSTLTEADGTYSVSGLAAGTYTVITSAAGFGDKINLITLSSGAAEILNVALLPASSTLRGSVRVAGTNQPVPGSLVQVFRIGTDIPVASVLTDGNGEYVITGLEPREYRVVFSADGFASDVYRIFLRNSEDRTLNGLLGRNPAVVRGRVTDAVTGDPILGAAVVTVVSGSGIIIASTLTDQLGNYILNSLPAGDYQIIFSAEGYVTNAVQVSLNAGGVRTLNQALQPNPATIRGTVRDADTLLPIEEALIQVFLPDGTFLGSTVTDRNGNYVIKGLPGGEVVINARAAGRQAAARSVLLVRGETATVNFLLEGNPASVSGFVTDAATGQPIPQVLVRIYPAGSQVPIRSTLSDVNGFYILTGLPAGRFIIRFTAPGYPERELEIVLAAGQNLRLDVTLGEVLPPSNLRPECISVEKVYDWVIAALRREEDVPLSAECMAFAEAIFERGGAVTAECSVSTLEATCRLSSFKKGRPGTIVIEGVANPVITLTVSDDDGESCSFTVPVYWQKEIAVCLPEGMDAGNINCSVIDVKCRTGRGAVTSRSVGLQLLVCLEVEIIDGVIMEVLAQHCMPRKAVKIESFNDSQCVWESVLGCKREEIE